MVRFTRRAVVFSSSDSYYIFTFLCVLHFMIVIRFIAYVFRPDNCSNILSNYSIRNIILFATPFFGDSLAGNVNSKQLPKCNDFNCYVVDSSAREKCFDRADAIVFHPISFDFLPVFPMFLRKRRNPKQQWIFMSFESPDTLTSMLPFGSEFYNWADGKFNATLTYRWDSDIAAPYMRHNGYELKPNATPVPFDHELYSQKRRHIAAVISNCNDSYGRLEYLDNLRSYGLSVDIYGSCGQYYCPGRVSTECYRMLEKDYFFYAGPENSICTDYVSEKFFYPLNHNYIVLVTGGANYVRIGPPHSFINSRDFNSPEELAHYLKQVASNETAYSEFFRWKGLYRFVERRFDYGCSLCSYVYEAKINTKKKVRNDLRSWFFEKSGCVYSPYKNLQYNFLGNRRFSFYGFSYVIGYIRRFVGFD